MTKNPDQLLQDARQARTGHRLEDAYRIVRDAVDLCRRTGAPLELARALESLGQAERDRKDSQTALQHYQEAVAIYRTLGVPLRLAHAVRHVADIYRHEGHADLAERCYQEALDIYRNNPNTKQLDLANAIRGYAALKSDAGDRRQARLLWQEARDLYAAVDVKEGVAESTRRLALLIDSAR